LPELQEYKVLLNGVILVSKDDLVEKEIAKTRAKSAIKIQHWKEQRHF